MNNKIFKSPLPNKVFYRVGHIDTKQGCWYDIHGNFTGMIHNEFDFLSNKDLQMPYNEKIVGYLSATASLEDLYLWFTKDDIEKLKPHGYRAMKYESNDYFIDNGHYVINKKNSKLIKIFN